MQPNMEQMFQDMLAAGGMEAGAMYEQGPDGAPVSMMQRRAMAMQERVVSLGNRLQKMADEHVAKRQVTEERWLKDVRQYNGEYAPELQASIDGNGGSSAFVSLTRSRCNNAEGRLAEICMPTDDRNWSIGPTPEPDVMDVLEEMHGPDAVDNVLEQAKRAAERMQRLIDDQLSESQFNAILRRVLHDAVVLGTGVAKGPVVKVKTHTSYKQGQDAAGMVFQIVREDVYSPSVEHVSPWDFFPDRSARHIDECEYVLQRHRMSRKEMRSLARQDGFDKAAIAELLTQPPRARPSGSIEQARPTEEMNNTDYRYEVWEYQGSLPPEDLQACGCDVDETAAMLEEVRCTVWVCGAKILKACVYPFDDAGLPYAVFNWERDDHSIFGYGVPYRCRHSQEAANSAWRAVLDNAALSVIPQVLVDNRSITPADGSWQLYPGKVWFTTGVNAGGGNPLQLLPVQSNLGDLLNIYRQAAQTLDEETGLPQLMSGQPAPEVTKTASGTAMLLNNSSAYLRRLVKSFDDDLVKPIISRFYHYNMQFETDESVKGDYDVIPLGSSSLLVKEQQTQGLLQLLQVAQQSPVLGPLTKFDELYRKLVQSMSINAEGVVKSSEEVQQEQQQQQANAQQQQPDPNTMRLQFEQAKLQQQQQEHADEMQLRQMQLQAQAQAEQNNQELRLQEMAVKQQAQRLEEAATEKTSQLELLKLQTEAQITQAQIQAAKEQTALEIDSKHQLFNAETALKQQMGSGI